MVVCGRVKDVIIMAGRNIYPTDIERAAGRVPGVRPGCAVAVRLDAGHSRETFAVAVESNAWQDPAEVRRIEHEVAHGRYDEHLLPLQSGVGNIANAVMAELVKSRFKGLTAFTEVVQDGMLDALDSGTLAMASATAFSSSPRRKCITAWNEATSSSSLLENDS